MLKETLTVFIEIFIALIAGIFFYKGFIKGWKILTIQVIIAFAVELSAYYIRTNHQPNGWLFNFYLIADFVLLISVAYFLIQVKRFQFIFLGAFSLFMLVWLYDVFYLFGISKFATHAYTVSSFLLIATYLYLLFYDTLHWKKAVYLSPVFWLSIAIIVFYGCNISYFYLMDIIIKTLSKDQKNLLLWLLKLLVAIRYLLVALSFYLVYYNNKGNIKNNIHAKQ
jgi:hypothetical protein